MIVKIWPIKGERGTRNCMLYIDNDEKVLKVQKDDEGHLLDREVINTREEFGLDADSFFIEQEENIDRVFQYMANQDKTKSKYVSGYMCDPDTVLDDFRGAIIENDFNGDVRHRDKDNERMAYHLVQSFPEGLNISDEEVHQCGIELLKKIDKHQGVVCSHVHPVIDEEGEVRGKCKHNHILLNAFIHPKKIDPQHPERVKYHACNESYAQLQIWNDEIAIDHGLPIILNPDLDKVYSWTENSMIKAGRSWKERMRLDIEAARRATGNWDDFVEYMKGEGYQIREGAHVTYTAPDGDKKARGKTLGAPYTREGLEMHWALRDREEREFVRTLQENEAPPLFKLSLQHPGPLTVDVPLGTALSKQRSYYPLPLEKANRPRSVLNTYFNERDLYDVKDANGKVIGAATGAEIVEYFESLRRGDDERYRRLMEDAERTEEEKQAQWEDILRQEREAAEQKQRERNQYRERYYYSRYKNSRTGQPYYTNLYDENGRRRSTLELIFMIAAVTIKSEDGLWEVKNPPPEYRNEPNFGPTDWKVQHMLDALHVSREEGLEGPSDVADKLNEVGAAYSRARAAVNRSQKSLDKMKALAFALQEYEATHTIVEKIDALPNGPEKEQLLEQYAKDIDRYKHAKAIMNGYKVSTQAEIDDFWKRYDDINRNLPEMEERYETLKEEYRKIKTLNYRLTLAQTELFVFGPAYVPERAANRGDLGRKMSKKEFDALER